MANNRREIRMLQIKSDSALAINRLPGFFSDRPSCRLDEMVEGIGFYLIQLRQTKWARLRGNFGVFAQEVYVFHLGKMAEDLQKRGSSQRHDRQTQRNRRLSSTVYGKAPI